VNWGRVQHRSHKRDW